MYLDQLNTGVSSLANIDSISLHTDAPGGDGSNELDIVGYSRQTPSWSTPSGGLMWALVTFSDVVGDITHIGMWDGDVFITDEPLVVSIPTAQDIRILVELTAEEKR